jgi:transcriptional regulator with XRE-family HTH domain
MRTIRQLRETNGETRLQLAVAIGVTPSTIYNWERGKYEPKASQLQALAQHFDVGMDEIDFEGPMQEKGSPPRSGLGGVPAVPFPREQGDGSTPEAGKSPWVIRSPKTR